MLIEQLKQSLKSRIVRNGIVKKIKLGPFLIPYHRNKRLNILLPFMPSLNSLEQNIDELKLRNYLIREELDENKKREILAELYREKLNKEPNFLQPQTFTEKINWLKLHYCDPKLTICCDKFKVKDYVKEKLGKDLCAKTLQSWDNVSDIDFDSLPERFVLKVNWSSGYNIFVENKSALSNHEIALMLKQLEIWTRPYSNSYYDSFNWGYKDMTPVIYAEEMLDKEYTQYEYKVFCFNGKPEFSLIEKNPNGSVPERVCVDCIGKQLDFCFGEQHKASEVKIMPCYEKLIDVARELSEKFTFVRIDFLVQEYDYYLGEMTFYSGGGFSIINPPERDKTLGDRIQLDSVESKEAY